VPSKFSWGPLVRAWVAHTIAWLYNGQHSPSYFFSRPNVRRNPQNCFSTIVRDLSDQNGQFRVELWKSVKNNLALRTSLLPLEQLERLIIEPATRRRAIGPLIVVVDALDESGEPADRRQLLSTFENLLDLTSQPIFAFSSLLILDSLPSGLHIVHKQLVDDIVDEDIENYIYHSLHRYPELDSRWPNKEWCRLLVYHSEHSFQWAATACRFIKGYYLEGLDLSRPFVVTSCVC
jgi:hypothetical protein